MNQMLKVLIGIDSSYLDHYLYNLFRYKQMANHVHLDHLTKG